MRPDGSCRPARSDLLAVGLALAAVYFGFTLGFGYLPEVESTMFWSPDSTSYREVADWLVGRSETDATRFRPFLYPLLLALTRAAGGTYGIWLLQFALWWLSGLLLFVSVATLTRRRTLAAVAVAAYAANLTLTVLTLHALTEIVTVFLVTVGLLLVACRRRFEPLSFALLLVLLAAALTASKPIFALVLIAALLAAVPALRHAWTRRARRWRLGALLLAALSPVLVQMGIMSVRHGTWQPSTIGSHAFVHYYVAKVQAEVNGVSIEESRQIVAGMGGRQIADALLQHPGTATAVYLVSVFGNLAGGSKFLDAPRPRPMLSQYMEITNTVYLFTHAAMSILVVLAVRLLLRARRWPELGTVGLLLVPVALIVASSGLSFGQGDRIVLPALPLWIAGYAFVVSVVVEGRS